jgi:hypothetical protein
MAEYKLCNMVAVYHLSLQIITSFFWEVGKLDATDFVVLDQRITLNRFA